ncbi:MAG: alpha/beta hydrolase [Firmicutes bacterium]|nr:alpha/beta hydrolase [Bacillota bacterium]
MRKVRLNHGIIKLSIPLILIISFITGCSAVPYTPAFLDENGEIIPGSIASLEKVNIGGVEQWLLIRGKSINNPVLLFIHGGPGSAEGPLVCHYNKKLEDYFIVVNWDQRGAGKSYSRKIPVETMTIAQFISDAYQVVDLLRKRFNQDKIFVIGHSWGSVLGILTVQKYPRLFYAYIGVGQMVNGKENERLSFEYALATALATNNQTAVRALNEINSPIPYWNLEQDGDWFNKLRKQREWLLKLGGCIYGEKSYHKWIKVFLDAPEYTTSDCVKWVRGNLFSVKAMWLEIMQIDLTKQVPKLEVPVYFLIGRHDYNTPFELALAYFNQLEAPKKEFIWFDNSAHSPMYEEADRFNDILIEKIRPEILGE